MGDMIYRPLIEGMRWSYSRAHGFNQCKYAWFLKYIHKSEKQERFYTSYGTFMHRLIEWFHRGLFTASELLNIFISDFSSSVKGERPNDGIVRKYIKAGIEYLKTLKPYPFKVVAVEEKIDFEIGGIQMTAVVDVLGQDDDGEYIIIDNKSRDLKPRSNREKPTVNDRTLDEMLRQLYIYAAAIKYKYGKYPKLLCFNCFKVGTFIEEPFREEKFDDAIRWLKEQIEEIKGEEDFPPNPEYFFCKYLCDVSQDCDYADMI